MKNNMPQCPLVCVKLFCVYLHSLYIVFCVPLENISVIQGRHHNRRIEGLQSLGFWLGLIMTALGWGREFCRALPTLREDLGLHGLI